MRGKRWLALGVVVVVAIAGIGIGIGGGLGGGDEKAKSPKVLNQPTEARKIRTLRPGQTPGFGRPVLEGEKHAKPE